MAHWRSPLLPGKYENSTLPLGMRMSRRCLGLKMQKKKSICVPKSVELQGEDQDQDQGQKKSITFDDIVSAIESYFKQYNPKSTKEGPNRFKLNELGAYIALWMKELYRFMEDDSRKRECAHLLATIGRRLLYKMTLKDQKELLKSVLAKPFNGPMFHEYHHELIGWHPMPIRCPAAYEEQKMLVAALIDKGVTPYVISKMPKLYLEAMIEHSKLKIELQHTFGSITEAEIHGKGEDDVMADVLLGKVQAADGEGKMKIIEAKLEGRTADFASGASMSDFEMINHVLKKGGFALLQQDGTLEEELINLVEATNKNDKNIKQAHIQKVNWKGAKWALQKPEEGIKQWLKSAFFLQPRTNVLPHIYRAVFAIPT